MVVLKSLFRPIPLSRPKDRVPRWRLSMFCVAAGIAMMVFSEALAFMPGLVDRIYSNTFSAWCTHLLARASGLVPFSLIETGMAVGVLSVLAPAVRAVVDVLRKRRHVTNALACAVTRYAGIAGLLIALFYALWGFNYARPDLPSRIGWDDSQLASLPRLGTSKDYAELVRLSTQLVFVTNYYYAEAMGSRDAGQHSVPKESYEELDRAIDVGYERATKLLGLDPSFGQSRGPAKAVYASRVMSKLGIAGFYSPWTGEANYNHEIPPFDTPLTIAHEKAHQRCVTSEDEANFLGFMACILSDSPYAKYSGYLFAQRQLLRELLRVDVDQGRMLIRMRCEGVQRDVFYGRAYASVFHGVVQTVSLAVNNAYLRANRVEGGLLSYQLSARLLVLFSRHNEGTCLVPPTLPAEAADLTAAQMLD